MEQIIHELNGKKYLLVEIPSRQGQGKKFDALIEKYHGIFQGVKEIKRESFWHIGYIIVKVLIPEMFIEDFNKKLIELSHE